MRVLAFAVLAVLAPFAHAEADPPPPADLAAMLAEVDAANPEVLAQEARARAALEVPGQLEALPDPKLSVSYTNDTLDAFTLGTSEFSNLTIGWEQEVPYKAVRNGAADVARAEAEVARRSADTLRARLRARVVSLYADLYRIDRTSELLRAGRDALTTELEAARARYESGEGIQEGLLQAQVAISRLDLELEGQRRERRGVEIDLNQALGHRNDLPIGPAVALPKGGLPEDPDLLVGAAVAAAPEVRETQGRTLQAEAAVANARVQTKPEFSWLAAYQYRGGLDPMVMGGFGVRLPVWKDRKQARGIARSEADLTAARREGELAELRAQASARSYSNDVASAERSLRLYREAVLPADIATLEAARAAFSAGKAEMGLVLSDFRRLLGDRVDAVGLETRRVQALAALEAVTGATLLDVADTGRAQ